ncbi:Peroxidase 5 [Acorus calamus]|uniref:Peroxidase n=1 Tax=Acorus calamus TaxID=4465 RepID=A0AAV9FJM5_ACOCL|nr:Peroxidase 5 [Acorus calamus]
MEGKANLRFLIASVLILFMSNVPCHAQLSPTFYDSTCPNALSTIRAAVWKAVWAERRMAASLIRLHFHDCFVQGCDGSLLLNNSSTIVSEKSALQNFRSARGFNVVDDIKSSVESVCPGVVSCADILAVASRDASVAVIGGPTWTVKLGRRDSTSAAGKDEVESNLPKFTDSLDHLTTLFANKGLNSRDMVALSGSHTIGQAACATYRGRIYNATDIDTGFASTRRRGCPSVGGDGNLAPLDLVTPNSFDNNYYKNLLQKKGLLQSDQVLFGSGGSTDGVVKQYSSDRTSFYYDFAWAMVKMGDVEPLTGS